MMLPYYNEYFCNGRNIAPNFVYSCSTHTIIPTTNLDNFTVTKYKIQIIVLSDLLILLPAKSTNC